MKNATPHNIRQGEWGAARDLILIKILRLAIILLHCFKVNLVIDQDEKGDKPRVKTSHLDPCYRSRPGMYLVCTWYVLSATEKKPDFLFSSCFRQNKAT